MLCIYGPTEHPLLPEMTMRAVLQAVPGAAHDATPTWPALENLRLGEGMRQACGKCARRRPLRLQLKLPTEPPGVGVREQDGRNAPVVPLDVPPPVHTASQNPRAIQSLCRRYWL